MFSKCRSSLRGSMHSCTTHDLRPHVQAYFQQPPANRMYYPSWLSRLWQCSVMSHSLHTLLQIIMFILASDGFFSSYSIEIIIRSYNYLEVIAEIYREFRSPSLLRRQFLHRYIACGLNDVTKRFTLHILEWKFGLFTSNTHVDGTIDIVYKYGSWRRQL